VHPDVPKEYVEKEIVRLRNLLKNTSSTEAIEKHVAVKNKNIILVDDGIAQEICRVSKYYENNLKKIIVAVPVLPMIL
jgi:predicted phosphoribosyltransferase